MYIFFLTSYPNRYNAHGDTFEMSEHVQAHFVVNPFLPQKWNKKACLNAFVNKIQLKYITPLCKLSYEHLLD